jgi:5-oxoprolinase (ATP-hydrolysing) subunit A
VLARLAAEAGLRAVPEGFADRAYLPDGRLVPRSRPGAVLGVAEAVAQAERLAAEGVVSTVDGSVLEVRVESLCVHGDTPGAVALAAQIRAALEARGVSIAPFVGS